MKHLSNAVINRFGFSAAFGRLRVETSVFSCSQPVFESAAFGRLRVETVSAYGKKQLYSFSRLRAAAC